MTGRVDCDNATMARLAANCELRVRPQIYQFTIHVTAYISVYTLVLMSLDRYLAVVHPIQSLTLRTQRHAMIAVVTATIAICILNTPTLPDYGLLEHRYGGEDRVACINMRLVTEDHYGSVLPHTVKKISAHPRTFCAEFSIFQWNRFRIRLRP